MLLQLAALHAVQVSASTTGRLQTALVAACSCSAGLAAAAGGTKGKQTNQSWQKASTACQLKLAGLPLVPAAAAQAGCHLLHAMAMLASASTTDSLQMALYQPAAQPHLRQQLMAEGTKAKQSWQKASAACQLGLAGLPSVRQLLL